jgi:Icc-related predicted phosphoesterase
VSVNVHRKKWKGWHKTDKQDVDACLEALRGHCTVLNDTGTVIDGVSFYGTSVQPPAPHRTMAFNVSLEEDRDLAFAKIPNNLDVLITHTPPFRKLDDVQGISVGCRALGRAVARVKPRYHVFGHIHECPGSDVSPLPVHDAQGQLICYHENTVFVNAAICDEHYCVRNSPVVVKIPVE